MQRARVVRTRYFGVKNAEDTFVVVNCLQLLCKRENAGADNGDTRHGLVRWVDNEFCRSGVQLACRRDKRESGLGTRTSKGRVEQSHTRAWNTSCPPPLPYLHDGHLLALQ